MVKVPYLLVNLDNARYPEGPEALDALAVVDIVDQYYDVGPLDLCVRALLVLLSAYGGLDSMFLLDESRRTVSVLMGSMYRSDEMMTGW